MTFRKIYTVALVTLGVAIIGTAAANARSDHHAAAARSFTIKLAKTSSGKLLVNGANGHTVYQFSKDSKNHDACMKVSGCAQIWPPLIASGKPSAGPGVSASLLGTTKLSNGKSQVTYAGHPLYTYSGDSSAASTGYLGFSSFGGTWRGVSATGKAVS
jgi:predicted lipoprotein with Yx(FWY)xxD motif